MQPLVYALQPVEMELEAGVHFWCACGLSGHQPMCDGEHTGTGMRSKKFVLTEKTRVLLCNCKRTSTPPFCDGTHKSLQAPPPGPGDSGQP